MRRYRYANPRAPVDSPLPVDFEIHFLRRRKDPFIFWNCSSSFLNLCACVCVLPVQSYISNPDVALGMLLRETLSNLNNMQMTTHTTIALIRPFLLAGAHAWCCPQHILLNLAWGSSFTLFYELLYITLLLTAPTIYSSRARARPHFPVHVLLHPGHEASHHH